MLDIRLIREEPEKVQKGVHEKGVDIDIQDILTLDHERKDLLSEVESLKALRNSASKKIGAAKKAGEDASAAIAEMKKVGDDIATLDGKVKEKDEALQDIMLRLPNLPHESTPEGTSEDDNVPVRSWGEPTVHDFEPKDHKEVGEALKMFDFARGAKISGSGFPVYTGKGAKLERALIQFFLDRHTDTNGFTEVIPPYLVNRTTMTGTGQLPKMEEDMYRCDKEDDLFLIPTAEVPVTNLHSNEVLNHKDLPISYCAYSACFRREAGSYGADTRGFLRLHQFNKVEMVKFVEPENSYDVLDELVGYAESLLQELGLHYRVLELCRADLSFAAAKCFDLEVWSPVEKKWLEVSSVSSFEDFQARRANIKAKIGGKNTIIHTLNGSGLATPRVLVALIDNYQNADGSITIPEVLRPYMGGIDTITL
ncbi:MAG: serine--tRNA ligase [Fibrobacterales bacterium]